MHVIFGKMSIHFFCRFFLIGWLMIYQLRSSLCYRNFKSIVYKRHLSLDIKINLVSSTIPTRSSASPSARQPLCPRSRKKIRISTTPPPPSTTTWKRRIRIPTAFGWNRPTLNRAIPPAKTTAALNSPSPPANRPEWRFICSTAAKPAMKTVTSTSSPPAAPSARCGRCLTSRPPRR